MRVSLKQVLLAAALVSPGSVAGCGRGEASDPKADPAPVLVSADNIALAEQADLQNGPLVSGSLAAEREATVRAELQGNVVQVLVDEGQRVTQGQMLGRISDDAVRDAVLSGQSQVRTATEALVVAKRNAERSEKLAAGGALAERDLEQARWSVTNADAALADAKARLAAAQKQLDRTEIRAPFTGVVSERHVSAGDVVQNGGALFTIVDPTSMRLEARVPVAALAGLNVGTPVPFTVDGYANRSFEGKIIRINPAADPATRQVRVTISIPNAGRTLVAGLFAQGRAAIERHRGVVVPISAVDRRALRPAVTRIRGGLTERVEVAVGIEDQTTDKVEITQGLAPGDSVVIGAARGIAPGTRVRPAAPAERGGGGN